MACECGNIILRGFVLCAPDPGCSLDAHLSSHFIIEFAAHEKTRRCGQEQSSTENGPGSTKIARMVCKPSETHHKGGSQRARALTHREEGLQPYFLEPRVIFALCRPVFMRLPGGWLWLGSITNAQPKSLRVRRRAGPGSSWLSNRHQELLVCPKPHLQLLKRRD